MSRTFTMRIPKDLAEWLEKAARERGVPQSKVVRDALERARNSTGKRAFMRFAGSIHGLPRDLSTRKGFSRD